MSVLYGVVWKLVGVIVVVWTGIVLEYEGARIYLFDLIYIYDD